MATDNPDVTVRDQRQASMGSDENALEKRRQVQKLVRSGDETVIPHLLKTVEAYLPLPSPEFDKGARAALPATLAAVDGLGRLCTIGASPEAEALLIRALVEKGNRLQCAAAMALAKIGSQDTLEQLDKCARLDRDAAVKACAKIAIRQIQVRARTVGSAIAVRTADELREIVKRACDIPGQKFKQAEKVTSSGERLRSPELIPNLFEVELHPSEGSLDDETKQREADQVAGHGDRSRFQKVYIQVGSMGEGEYDGQNSRTDVEHKHAGLTDSRALDRVNVHKNYIVLFTPCGPVGKNAQYLAKALQLNAKRTQPDENKTAKEFFAQGAIGIYKNRDLGMGEFEFCMFETLPLDDITVGKIQKSIQVLAYVGDELEKKFRPGGGE
jgi:hypothetical protein